MIDRQRRARGYQETVERSGEGGGLPARKTFEKGRVAYLAALRFDGPLPPMGSYFEISDRFWKLPANWRDLVDSVRWAARDQLPAAVSGPPYLVSNLVAQPEKRRLLLHLVNYNHRRRPAVAGIEVRCRIPGGDRVPQVMLYSPEGAPVALKAARIGEEAVFTVPRIGVYGIAAITW
jgi:hypothetical protein